MKEILKLSNLIANKGEKVQGLIQIYDTSYQIPVTLINGEQEGKTVLITAGIHGCEFPCIQTVIELAKEIDPKDVYGNIMLIHPVNTQAFAEKVSAVVPEDNKNINRVFPGNKEGSISDQIAHFLTHECTDKADFYIDLHGGDLHELVIDYVYYPGIGEEEVINFSKEIASILDVEYMVKSNATTGAYNSAAIRGIPSILIERGGRGIWSREEVDKYKKDVRKALNKLEVLKEDDIDHKNVKSKVEISNAIYVNSEKAGCWYPEVRPDDLINEGELLGTIRDFFGNIIETHYSKVKGVVLYMTVSLSVKENDSLIAYGETV